MRIPLAKSHITSKVSLTDFWKSIDAFWVGGLALLLVFLGNKLLPIKGEAYEWAQYLILGTIFPASLLAIITLKKYVGPLTIAGGVLRVALFLCFTLIPLPFLFNGKDYYVFIIAFIQLCLMWKYCFSKKVMGISYGSRFKVFLIIMCYFVLILSWKAAATLLWWAHLDDWILSSTYATIVFIISAALVSVNVYANNKDAISVRPEILSPINVIAIAVLAIFSFRTDYLFQLSAFHHWGVFVGPAELVQQGGWLLWDVPSQYGFLSILTLAVFPAKNVWQSLYIVNSTLLLVSACFVFFILRALWPGLLNYLFALGVALSGVLLVTGWFPNLLGPQGTPSVGAFRFIWCYLLLGILLYEMHSPSREMRKRSLYIGSIIWLLSVFWSAEIAIYCSVIWLPAFTFLMLQHSYAESHSWSSAIRSSLIKSSLLIALVLVVVASITAYYLIRLGHTPDWPAYFEYAFSFSEGFLAEAIDPSGPVWILFIVFCGLATTFVYFFQEDFSHRALGLLIGAWGALWSTSSYFVPRSAPSYVANLSPLFCTGIVIMLYIFMRYQLNNIWVILLKASLVPILVFLLTTTLGYQQYIGPLIFSSPRLVYAKEVQQRLPRMDPSLISLLESSNVKANDPIYFFDANMPPVWPASDGSGDVHLINHAWLPVNPYALVLPLPEKRIQLYMARFSARSHLSGWLIQPKSNPYTTWPWFAEQLALTHMPTKKYENDNWQLIWFEYRGAAP